MRPASLVVGVIMVAVILGIVYFVAVAHHNASLTTTSTASTATTTPPSPLPAPSPQPVPQPTAGAGTIVGHLSIGPLCPVETNPPQPGCQPGPAQYSKYQMVVYNVARTSVVGRAAFDAQGNYHLALPAASYVVDITPHSQSGVGGISGVPTTVVLSAGATLRVDVSIDTGIR